MCNRFLEDFVNKVIDKSICCGSCETRRKICNKIEDDYFHMDEKSVKEIIKYDHYLPEKLCRDLALSFLHNQMFRKQKHLYYFINYIENCYYTPEIEKHDCFQIPSYIVYLKSFNSTYVEIYESVEMYYNAKNPDDENHYECDVFTFKEWLNRKLYI